MNREWSVRYQFALNLNVIKRCNTNVRLIPHNKTLDNQISGIIILAPSRGQEVKKYEV